MRVLRGFIFVALFLLVLSPGVRAQLTTATIVGNVQDSSGAYIAGAKVTATNVDTQFTRSVTSAADGAYRLDFMPVGTYTLTVEAQGLSSQEQRGLVLTLNAEV